jgi:hypothetical protein
MKLPLIALLTLAVGACTYVPMAGSGTKGNDTVMVCHKGKKTMELPRSAAAAHRDHGDRYGPC